MVWYLVKVVWYDGVGAYVSQFALPVNSKYELTKETKSRVEKYLDGNGEILKYDLCYSLSLDNILAFRDDEFNRDIYDRFQMMYFND